MNGHSGHGTVGELPRKLCEQRVESEGGLGLEICMQENRGGGRKREREEKASAVKVKGSMRGQLLDQHVCCCLQHVGWCEVTKLSF